MRVLFNKFFARLYLIAHQNAERLVRLHGVFNGNLHNNAVFRVHGCLPKLFGVHFAKALVAAYLGALAQLLRHICHFHFVIGIFYLLPLLYFEQRRLRNIHMPVFNQRAHKAEEKG